jgi:hypothetical protein
MYSNRDEVFYPGGFTGTSRPAAAAFSIVAEIPFEFRGKSCSQRLAG